ncbi:MAG: class A beta-lactamase-related serine hydrolase [Cyanosarcina radialis HA8281-LM2]|jgi:beta-lactamase class A|nr:class A beta-lactamase-related serine hydrolase [Cyanosarcina radialis HA8281-LM2]
MARKKNTAKPVVGIAIALATTLTIAGLAVSRIGDRNSTASSPKSSAAESTALNSSAVADTDRAQAPEIGRENSEAIYNVTTPPSFKPSARLDRIVNELVDTATAKGLSTQPLSITLIDVKTGEIAEYQSNVPRYPASVVKMFWMVAFFGRYTQPESAEYNNDLPYVAKMVQQSDNNAAGFILDRITDTKSQGKLSAEEFKIWFNKRDRVNRFFQQAGYSDININQKTFPVGSMSRPQGTDLQMRGDPKTPIRNQISSDRSARLIYEIFNGRAGSPAANEIMQKLLTRDLRPEAWNQPNYRGFNPVRGFFGQALTKDNVIFASKAGWTSSTRGEAAFVTTTDGQTAYVLSVFGDSRAYAGDGQIFPQMSRIVFDRLTVRN